MSNELVFYTHPMSRGRIIRWMLEEVGQPYRTEVLDYATTLRPEDDMTVLVVRRADSLPVPPPLRLDSADNRFVTSLVALPDA